MITAIFSVVFLFCLFYGQLPLPVLIIFCIALGVFLGYLSRHQHSDVLSIDVMAQKSRLKKVHPVLKFGTLFTLIILCVVSPNPLTGVFLLFAMIILVVFVGGLNLHRYIRILSLPVAFLLIAGFALLFYVSPEPTGVLNIPLFGYWLSVSTSTQAHTALIVSRALGAVSCLCSIGVTTPMPDIIGVLRSFRCPSVMIDLMYLIYRYIFILLSLHHEMYNAVRCRLGFRDYRTSLRATGMIYTNLLARSYQFASKNFDAMESRCFDTGIVFLQRRAALSALQVALCVLLLLITLCFAILPL